MGCENNGVCGVRNDGVCGEYLGVWCEPVVGASTRQHYRVAIPHTHTHYSSISPHTQHSSISPHTTQWYSKSPTMHFINIGIVPMCNRVCSNSKQAYSMPVVREPPLHTICVCHVSVCVSCECVCVCVSCECVSLTASVYMCVPKTYACVHQKKHMCMYVNINSVFVCLIMLCHAV